MLRVIVFIRRHDTLLLLIVALLTAAASIIVNYFNGTIMAYGDAESHINIAKRVVDGLTPGFGQLGGVWLPLHHLLMVPFVANDFMWRSGIGGAAVSGMSFVAAALFIYGLTTYLTGTRLLGLIAFLVFSLNPNILYMLATPMSELPLLAFMLGSIYFFVKWIAERGLLQLVLAAALIFAASLIRYDAWFLLFIEVVIIAALGLREKWGRHKVFGVLVTFGTLAVFGAVLWLLWSLVIFHDPFYFMNSPYSAKSQQMSFRTTGELPSYHNVVESLRLYGGAAIANVSVILAAVSVLGAAVYAVAGRSTRTLKAVVIMLLISPFLFNVLSLYLGISILFVPGVTPENFRYSLFNIRYGLMMVPAVAIFVALFLTTIKNKAVKVGMAVLVVAFAAVFALTPAITLKDGTEGLSARFPNGVSGINGVFKDYYDHGYVAFDDFSRSANPIELGVPIDKIIYVGSHPYWEDMLARPNQYARWIVIRRDDALDRAFGGNATFAQDYTGVFKQGDTVLYKCTNNCSGWAE